jgi:hypothetical protein
MGNALADYKQIVVDNIFKLHQEEDLKKIMRMKQFSPNDIFVCLLRFISIFFEVQ